MALDHYHDKHGSYPAAYTIGANGVKLHSWRTLLLPYLGEAERYSQIRLDEPWDSPHNKPLSQKSLEIFVCPSARNTISNGTNYFAIVSPYSAWPAHIPLMKDYVGDGLYGTILLIEANTSAVSWMEPRDMTQEEAINWIQRRDGHQGPHGRATATAMASGNVHLLKSSIDRKVLLSLISVNGGNPLPGIDWPELAVADPQLDTPRNTRQMKHTEVWPVTDREIVPGRSVLYCCSVQIAWDQARKAVRMAPIEVEGDVVLARQLNAQSFPATDLSPRYYVAHAGHASQVIPLIQNELQSKFPKLQPKNRFDRSYEVDFILYGYLQKNLPFKISFDRLQKALSFRQSPVESFGIEEFEGKNQHDRQLSAQVAILNYRSGDDFILRLIPRDATDEIVLAKVTPEKTLAETMTVVQQRIVQANGKQTKPELQIGDSLVVPVLVANLERTFDELIGRRILTDGLPNLPVMDARQIIRFQLDESGVKLESEFVEISGDEAIWPSKHPRKMVFDKPFLIWLRETQATEPYFAAWIENTELMTPFVR